jgi:DNA-binding protein H-NS
VLALFSSKREGNDAIAQISKIMTESGISLADIQAKFGVKKAKTEEKSTTKAKIAFVGPNGEKWSGRGRPARWVSELEKDGGSRETYKVAVTKKETANEQAENPSTI